MWGLISTRLAALPIRLGCLTAFFILSAIAGSAQQSVNTEGWVVLPDESSSDYRADDPRSAAVAKAFAAASGGRDNRCGR
jgi:hypothetical protein